MAGPDSAIGSFALCICTYKRPTLFVACIDSVAALAVPAGIDFQVIVADNNAESHYEAYIGERLSRLPFRSVYGHEPLQGYSNIRNKAIELALATAAEIIAFVDDDTMLASDWLGGHVRSYAAFDCDVVEGATRRGRARESVSKRFVHGQMQSTATTSNVSFKRWLVDANGAGLRFDPRFNITGNEDKTFFSAAHQAGARIVFSDWPIVFDHLHDGDISTDELLNKAMVAAIGYRNKVARLRKERGYLAGLAAALWGLSFSIKAVPAYIDAWVSRVVHAPERAKRRHASAHKNLHKMLQGFKGLHGDYAVRQDTRRSF